MMYFATVRAGVVVFDGDRPSEGTVVTVRESEPPDDAAQLPPAGTLAQQLSALSEFAPSDVFPADASANVAHHLYGHAKR